ncbi:MAG: hypothetical protein AAF725_06000 [Acidobacteriota bacterium]
MISLLLSTLFVASITDPALQLRELDPSLTLADVDRALQIERLAGMSSRDELSYLLGPRPSVGERGPRLRSRSARLRSLLSDPALASVYDRIEDSWLRCLFADPRSFRHLRSVIDAKMLIARDLHERGVLPDRLSVARSFGRILELRKRFGDLELVAGRNVVYAASQQRLGGGRGRVFGRAASQSLLERRADSFSFLSTRRGASGREALEPLLDQEDLTFYFEGHGNARRLDLAGSLSARQMAKMLAAGPARGSAPVLILASCRSHDFARRLFSELDRLSPGHPKPILIVPEEYGQNLLKSVFTSDLLRSDLGVGVAGGSTLGFALENPRNTLSVFVPDSDNLPIQIL